MRIAFGGISIEATNFSPIPSTLDDFVIYRGQEMLASDRYPFLQEFNAELIPTLFARALPGGTLEAHAYQILKDDLLARLAAIAPVDGFYLDLHGAMKVDGMDDAEA